MPIMYMCAGSKSDKKGKMKSIFCIASFFISFAIATAAEIPQLRGPVVLNKVMDRFAAPGNDHLEGFLGGRIMLNLERRLLQVDTSLFLSGFKHRPGSQKWIGEHIGKFLFASANTDRYTHDDRLKVLTDDLVRKYIATQLPDGYLGTYLPKDYWSEWDVWSHKYAIIGLLSYYAETGYAPALDAARKAGDLICKTFGNAPGQLDLNKSGHHTGMASGSILEAIVDLYRYTGDRKYLSFAEYILSNWETESGPRIISGLEKYGKVTKVGNAKAYEMMSCFLGILKYYKLTGNPKYLQPMLTAWTDIVNNRLYITGTSSAAEHFQEDDVLPAAIEDKMGEGCVTVTWIQFNEQLLRITGELKFAAEIERAVYNHLLAAENMESGCVSYYTPLQGAKPYKCKLTCCLSSVPRAISMIPDLVWGRIGNEFSVLMYEAGKVKDSIVSADGSRLELSLHAATDFPAKGTIIYTVSPSRTSKFAINFRIPDWADNYTITINGTRQPVTSTGLARIERVWGAGDKVAVHFDMPLKEIDGGKSYPGHIAFKRGPQVLAIDSTLNTDYNSLLASLATQKSSGVISDAGSVLPKNWVGRQAYEISYPGSKTKLFFIAVPFSDAGQTGGLQQVWVPAGKVARPIKKEGLTE